MAAGSRIRAGCLIVWSLAAAMGRTVFGANSTEDVTIYPSYGYQQQDTWIVPLRMWVHEDRPAAVSLVVRATASLEKLAESETSIFRRRITDFVADSESREVIVLSFDNDPANEEMQVVDADRQPLASDMNGLIQGTIQLSSTRAAEILKAQNSANGWLTIRVVSKGHSGQGRIRLISENGVSVVSDIDDTIKVTEIPAGRSVVIHNTFFREFVAVPGMANRFSEQKDAAFHYVSGGPWQLYEPLSEFLCSPEVGFPEGSWHMKTVTKNLMSGETWKNLGELTINENFTYEQKVRQISELMTHFPGTKFILVGDSGERDPDVYREIQKRFPDQVQEILIRDVIDDRTNRPERLMGMTIIPVEKATAPD